jgi:hypothetical protein
MKDKNLPDTTFSRAIVIEMKRKLPGEQVTHFSHVDDSGLADLRGQILRWVTDKMAVLKEAKPAMPAGFDNRLGDNWRLLLAIADAAGGEWPEKARDAAKKLSATVDANSRGTELLTEIKALFEAKGIDRLSSEEIVNHLATLEGRPWAEWRAGKPMTKNALASMLSRYQIFPGTIRLVNGETAKGYYRSAFDDAFVRYLPPQTVTTSQSYSDGHFLRNSERHSCLDVTDQKSQKPNKQGHCDDVTIRNDPMTHNAASLVPEQGSGIDPDDRSEDSLAPYSEIEI